MIVKLRLQCTHIFEAHKVHGFNIEIDKESCIVKYKHVEVFVDKNDSSQQEYTLD